LIAAYLMYWTGVSIHHIVVISHDTTALNQKIALTRAKNRVLTTDIHELDNRGDLKGMLTGKIPFPNPTSP
jgi:cell division protein FtsB